MARYYEETECEHGRMIDCDEPRIVSRDDDGGYVTEFCPGGVRRELVIDYEAALESLRTMFYPNEYSDGYALEAVTQAVDAALSGDTDG